MVQGLILSPCWPHARLTCGPVQPPVDGIATFTRPSHVARRKPGRHASLVGGMGPSLRMLQRRYVISPGFRSIRPVLFCMTARRTTALLQWALIPIVCRWPLIKRPSLAGDALAAGPWRRNGMTTSHALKSPTSTISGLGSSSYDGGRVPPFRIKPANRE